MVMPMRWFFLLGPVLGLVLAGAALASRGDARAAGPCGTPHDALDGDEGQFVQLVQAWRDQNLPHSSQLQVSGALNAAAAWFAQWQVDNGAPGGHIDGHGRTWVQRAIDCGYTGTTSFGAPYAQGSGEGIRAYAASVPISVTPQQAAADMAYPGSGIFAWTNSTSLPFKCVGAGRAASADGRRVAWVVVVAQYPAGLPCPGSTVSLPTPTPTPAASPTPTRSPTPTPTASPTPLPRGDGAFALIREGWNLIVLPPGPLTGVLARARGCYSAVYQFDGAQWRRYIPGAPGYVNTLFTLDGGPVWVAGTTANCGLILL
jgi:hypothetical protein